MENSLKCTCSSSSASEILPNPKCKNPFCFFCAMNEPNPSLRRSKIAKCFKEMPLRDDKEHVLVLSGLWNIAMTQPNDPEFPSLGIFECMGKLINKGINDQEWLLKDQNIYIPYYAAHIIGSFTIYKPEFAEKAINSGVVLPLMELFRGKITWVEQRVAVRALGHLASHERAFEAIANEFEVEIIELAMELATNCSKTIYKQFVCVKERKRLKYHCDLLTRGLGGEEKENQKVEEWAIQIQYWSLYLLNCFAFKERSISTICKKQEFLKDLCSMWGGLDNRKSPGGIGVIRSLCNTRIGRESIANIQEVIVALCNKSRTSDSWQYMAIDSLLLLLKDANTRLKVIEIAALFLVDLVELKQRNKIGDTIAQILLQDYNKIKYGGLKLKNQSAEEALKEIWELKVERRKKEEIMSDKELKERINLAQFFKKEGNKKFWYGLVGKAVMKYTKGLQLCPLKMRKERIVLYSNRAQCYLVLRNPEAAIRDTTRALSLCDDDKKFHGKSLWRRSQAYDMKGMAKESLMDCFKFIINDKVQIPYYAARMINKQMNATWVFADAKSNGEEEMNGIINIKGKKGIGRAFGSTYPKPIWVGSDQTDAIVDIVEPK